MPSSTRPLLASKQDSGAVDFQAAVALIPSGVVLTDATLPDNPIVYVNAAFESITGYPAAEVIGRNCRLLQGPDSDPATIAAIRSALALGREVEVEVLNYRKNGQPFWNRLKVGPRRDAHGRVVGFVGIQNDITAKRTLTLETYQLQARLNAIIDNMPGYVFQRILRRDGTLEISYLSSSVVRALGLFEPHPTTLEALWAWIHPDDRKMMREGLLRSATDLSPLTLEFRVKTIDGAEHWLRNYAKARRNEAGDVIWDGVGIDVTAEKNVEERLSYLAYHDPLTGLGNRMLFGQSLGRAMAAAEQAGERTILLRLDLDSFDEVNEAIGQQAGDAVLKEVAGRISHFAETRHGFAARMGGDEFAVFYGTSRLGDDSESSAAALATALAAPILGQGEPIAIDASIGSAYFPFAPSSADPSTQSEFMRRANVALLEARQAGRGQHRAYISDSVDQNGALMLRPALRHAIDGDQLRLHYQPLVEIATGEILGVEALVRWQNPELGLLPPARFIPLAETSGLMVPLGNWILNEAMRQCREWKGAGLTVPMISLNVSAVQLRERWFFEALSQLLARNNVEARQFEIELTEGVMIDASDEMMLSTLNRLRAAGFGLAVDDFGAGHASLQYLRDFPISRIKIDQAFTRHMAVEPSDASIIRAILQIARTSNLDVVAEGIETVQQRDFLRHEGCRIGQGFFYSEPLPAAEFASLLQRQARLPEPVKSRKGRRPAAM